MSWSGGRYPVFRPGGKSRVGQTVALILIALLSIGAVVVDIAIIPPGARIDLSVLPEVYLLLILLLSAAGLALWQRSTSAVLSGLALVTVALFVYPIVSFRDGVDISSVFIGRSIIALIFWLLVAVSLYRRQANALLRRGATQVRDLSALTDENAVQQSQLHKAIARGRSLETHLRQAQELAGLGSWEQDITTGKFWWSNTVGEMINIDADVTDGSQEKLDSALDPQSRIARQRMIRTTLSTGQSGLATLFTTPDTEGKKRKLEERCAPIRREDDCIVGVVGTIRDITEQDELLTEVQALTEQLLALSNVAFDAVLTTENNRIISVSHSATRLLGFELAEVIGKSPMDLLAPEYRRAAKKFRKKIQTDEPFQAALLARDGSHVPVEVFAVDVSRGESVLRVIAVRNISNRLSDELAIATTVERERNRIGFDLHDHVGQLLVGTNLAVESLKKEIGKTAPSDSRLAEQAERVSELVRDSIAEIRQLSTRLAPRVLDSGDVCPALQSLCLNVNNTGQNISCQLTCNSNRSLGSSEAAIHVFRVAEEAVSNAVKHSAGSQIEVRFGRRGQHFEIEIVDNGVGICQTSQDGDGVGMRSMAQRARLLGGSLEVAALPGGGTRVLCRFRAPPQAATSLAADN